LFLFPSFPGVDQSTCLDPEPACHPVPLPHRSGLLNFVYLTLSLPAILYLCPTYLDYWPLSALDLLFACPCLINKLLLLRSCLHLGLTWNVILLGVVCVCVCIWPRAHSSFVCVHVCLTHSTAVHVCTHFFSLLSFQARGQFSQQIRSVQCIGF
jgi:hypothetical protein